MQCTFVRIFSRLFSVMATPTKVSTFVFVDLETTGLPNLEQNRTKITEISLVALKRTHILNCPTGEAPRVKHKLTMCFNPGKLISPNATAITGLCNDSLENEPSFKQAFDTIESFISTLKKPVCLLAHNGLKFDYPILKAALNNIGKKFSAELLCADTIHAYHDILSEVNETKLVENNETDSINNTIDKDVQVLKTNELTTIANTVKDETDFQIEDEIIPRSETKTLIQIQNETTPKKNKIPICPKTPSKRKVDFCRVTNAKRRLTWQECKGKSMSSIYSHLTKKSPEGSHEAEYDCLMNVECAVAVGEKFVRWVDGNYCAFDDVAPMTIGVRLQ